MDIFAHHCSIADQHKTRGGVVGEGTAWQGTMVRNTDNRHFNSLINDVESLCELKRLLLEFQGGITNNRIALGRFYDFRRALTLNSIKVDSTMLVTDDVRSGENTFYIDVCFGDEEPSCVLTGFPNSTNNVLSSRTLLIVFS